MQFLPDANLSAGLGNQLREAGYDCIHISALLRSDASDREVADAANRLQATLMTKDADFVALRAVGILAGPLVWLRYGNMSTRQTAARLVPTLPGIVAAITGGEGVVEVW